ncbi:MAG TPA: phosphatidate cytidylyltransferase [Ramlibacter sp.]|jgi:phosphatidate cytidylyltransferase
MLKQRIITALVLLAILLPALFWRTPEPFLAITLLLIAAGGWEWGRLNGLAQGPALACGAVTLALSAATWWLGWPERPSPTLWAVVGAAWVLVGAWLVRAGVPGWPRIPLAARLVVGLLSLVLAWLAMAQARVIGVNFLLSVLVLVWAADVFAYIAGKTLGMKVFSRKLAPTISPGKSWEGAIGGMAAVVVLAVAWTFADFAAQAQVGSLYTRLAAMGWAVLVIGVVFLAAMSVVGDLVESLVKRSSGFKDSSQLLPGHGGVLDRVDGLLPTLPLAMMLASLAQR